jgi:hypothetical protein
MIMMMIERRTIPWHDRYNSEDQFTFEQYENVVMNLEPLGPPGVSITTVSSIMIDKEINE